MVDFGSTFERLELKYLISEDAVEAIRAAIGPWCRPDKHNDSAESGGYRIENLYLDSPDRECHRQWKRSDPERFKLRIRTYGPTGPAFMEIKRKVNRVIYKERCTVDRNTVEDAAHGFGMPLGGPDARKQRTLDRFAILVARIGARPTLCVSYEREAWVSDVDRYARVTFDRRLRAQPTDRWLLLGDDTRPWLSTDKAWLLDGLRSPVVLELKCETHIPLWMSDLIQRFQLNLKGFSKYGQGIDAMLREEGNASAYELGGGIAYG